MEEGSDLGNPLLRTLTYTSSLKTADLTPACTERAANLTMFFKMRPASWQSGPLNNKNNQVLQSQSLLKRINGAIVV